MTNRRLLTDAEWKAIHQAFTYKPIEEVWNSFTQTSLRFKASYLFLNIYISSYWFMHAIGKADSVVPNIALSADPMLLQVMSGRLLIGLLILTMMNAAFYFKTGFKMACLAMLVAYLYSTLSMAAALAPLMPESNWEFKNALWAAVRLAVFIAIWQLYRSEELN